ncbi:hypothetical protein [Streptomyces pinistramenti]|uniref:hypothetical protein n=1 Tax=Streptomyces pinistramenti TaxID=2884812 RepID=UPI001D077174|nr:hypothetical protein [Streptomyces pinistramenti]MCB5910405.1 hypothetical protein [Streptomyces pinistramenti]
MHDDPNRLQGREAPGIGGGTAETWGNPSVPPYTPPADGYRNTPSDSSGQHPAHRRRRLDINIDSHFELALYISPRLLRWFSGICITMASGSWYLLNH